MQNVKEDLYRQFHSDCSKCSGLCCTALFFSKMDGFPEDKEAGKPCRNLQKDFRCKIHEQLEAKHMKGCIGYDCLGAGTWVTERIYAGVTWQEIGEKRQEIFDVFVVVFQLFQVRYYLTESYSVLETGLIQGSKEKDEKIDLLQKQITILLEDNKNLCAMKSIDILQLDLETHREQANRLIKDVCQVLASSLHINHAKEPQDYFGRKCSKKDFRGYDFNMKLLIASDFEGCKFQGATFLGADTRDCNFANADLSETVFLTQGQVNAAKGNHNTKLPDHLEYPVTWK